MLFQIMYCLLTKFFFSDIYFNFIQNFWKGCNPTARMGEPPLLKDIVRRRSPYRLRLLSNYFGFHVT